jgi:hypothetical protein
MTVGVDAGPGDARGTMGDLAAGAMTVNRKILRGGTLAVKIMKEKGESAIDGLVMTVK